MKDIEDYRKKINGIDDQLISLLNERGKRVIKMGKLKELSNLVVYQSNREKEIIERVEMYF